MSLSVEPTTNKEKTENTVAVTYSSRERSARQGRTEAHALSQRLIGFPHYKAGLERQKTHKFFKNLSLLTRLNKEAARSAENESSDPI